MLLLIKYPKIQGYLIHYRMDILVIGEDANLKETREKFGDRHQYRLLGSRREFLSASVPEAVFDFFPKDDLSNLDAYDEFSGLPVFFNTTSRTLSALSQSGLTRTVFGFCGMPTFLNREVLEVSLLPESKRQDLQDVCDRLGTTYLVVADHIGLVTPRVICMIINEAYRTVEEGTATREDIDLAMKLGTNYPYGPFEWCQRIGIAHVAQFLGAMHRETKEERYRMCGLLEREAGSK